MSRAGMHALVLAFAFAFAVVLPATATAAAQPSVVVDSLAGKAEVKRAGHQDWARVQAGLKLYNNDMLRVLDSSLARLEWHNGGAVFVHANSQMLVNLHADTVNNIGVKHATVFFGAVFFVIKKALPKTLAARYNTKIYTPTAALSIRGTSFEVDVDKNNGATNVRVVNGTVLVGNILKNESLFLSAGYKTHIAMNADPVVPKPVLDKEIEDIKVWVPPKVVGVEIEKQLAEAKTTRRVIADKLSHQIHVLPLVNGTTYQGAWNITSALATFLADRLKSTNKNLAVSVGKEARTDPVAAGQEAKARFVVTGEIRGFDIIQRAEITARADQYDEYSIARVRLHLQLVDVETRTMVWESDVTGEVSGSIDDANSWKTISKKNLDMKDQAFASTILGGAINQAMDQSSTQINRYLTE